MGSLESLLRLQKTNGIVFCSSPYPSSVSSAVFDTFGCPFGPISEPLGAILGTFCRFGGALWGRLGPPSRSQGSFQLPSISSTKSPRVSTFPKTWGGGVCPLRSAQLNTLLLVAIAQRRPQRWESLPFGSQASVKQVFSSPGPGNIMLEKMGRPLRLAPINALKYRTPKIITGTCGTRPQHLPAGVHNETCVHAVQPRQDETFNTLPPFAEKIAW